MLGYPEIILILAVVLLIFGPSKLPEIARALGNAMKEFRKAASELEEQTRIIESPITALPKATQAYEKQVQGKEHIDQIPANREAAYTEKATLSNMPNDHGGLADVAAALKIDTEGKTDEQLRHEIVERVKNLGKGPEEV